LSFLPQSNNTFFNPEQKKNKQKKKKKKNYKKKKSLPASPFSGLRQNCTKLIKTYPEIIFGHRG
jgi:hypothetical protein